MDEDEETHSYTQQLSRGSGSVPLGAVWRSKNRTIPHVRQDPDRLEALQGQDKMVCTWHATRLQTSLKMWIVF